MQKMGSIDQDRIYNVHNLQTFLTVSVIHQAARTPPSVCAVYLTLIGQFFLKPSEYQNAEEMGVSK